MKNPTSLLRILLVASLFIIGSTFAAGSAEAAEPLTLGVTQISAVRTFATADNTFNSGWKWVFDVTVPANETIVTMKFADWTGAAGTIPATSNIRFYSAQFSNASDEAHAITISAANTYSDPANLNTMADLNVSRVGRQIQITVEARVPADSAGGSYSTSYGINSATDTVAPVITIVGEPFITVTVGTTYTDAGATALDNFDGTITSKIAVVNPVNTATIGTYRVIYNVSDSKGNTATEVVRTVNVVANTSALNTAIASARTLHGSAVEGVQPGQYADGAKETLNGIIEDAMSVRDHAMTQQEVDEILAELEDAVTTFEGKRIAADTTAPTLADFSVSELHISPNGDSVKDTTSIDVRFSEKVKAEINILDVTGNKVRGLYSDNSVTNPQAKIWDGKNTNGIVVPDGVYAIQVMGTDVVGNEMTNTEKKITVDTVAPVITVLGDSTPNITLGSGSSYSDAGATALDNGTVNITSSIVTTFTPGPIDLSTEGTYIVHYNVSDAAGNKAAEVIRTVTVATEF